MAGASLPIFRLFYRVSWPFTEFHGLELSISSSNLGHHFFCDANLNDAIADHSRWFLKEISPILPSFAAGLPSFADRVPPLDGAAVSTVDSKSMQDRAREWTHRLTVRRRGTALFFLGDVDGRRRRAPRQTLRHRAAVRAERRGGDAAGQVGQRVVDRRLRRPQSHLQVHHPEARRAGQRTRARHGQRRLDHRSGQRVQRRPLGGAVGAQGRRRLPVPRQLRQQRRRGPAVRAEQPRHPAPRR